MNLATHLEKSAYYFPDRPVLVEEDRTISYLEFNKESNRVATALKKMSINMGDHVALWTPNSPLWLAFYFGVLKAGAVAVTLPSTMPQSEIIRLLDDAQPKVLFTVDEKLGDLGDQKNCPYIEKIISPGGDLSYERLLENGSDAFKAVDLDRQNTAVILCSDPHYEFYDLRWWLRGDSALVSTGQCYGGDPATPDHQILWSAYHLFSFASA